MKTDSNYYSDNARTNAREQNAIMEAIHRIQAIVEFSTDGTILHANQLFLDTMGYPLAAIVGKHHSMFCDPDYTQGELYQAFWQRLATGQIASGDFERVGANGKPVWLHASYNPVYGEDGAVCKIVKFASDITAAKMRAADAQGKIDALHRLQAVIEFDLEGRVLNANDNFLDTFGYNLSEIVGQHHRMFCDSQYVRTTEYSEFWKHLGSGESHAGDFKRLSKDGAAVWIHATYNPVFDASGKPVKVVKFATDITAATLAAVDSQGKIDAIERVQAVIEFDLQGRVLRANDNFLNTFGYHAAEVEGQHHRMFCDPDFTRSPEYIAFWERLSRGEFNAGEYRRVNKHGDDVWIQATYNPILDIDGKPLKVVKFATDITPMKLLSSETAGKLDAISRSQAVIEFDMQGNVLTANNNFLRTIGYTAEEVKGRHHSMFCEEELVKSPAYRHFWADLGEGQFKSARFKRQGKHGAEVWLQATYNPILDVDGKPYKVVKFAMDVTEQVQPRGQLVESQGQGHRRRAGRTDARRSRRSPRVRSNSASARATSPWTPRPTPKEGSKPAGRARAKSIQARSSEASQQRARDHRHHQRHRRPDPPAGLQRGDRGRARGGARQVGFSVVAERSAQAGREIRQGSA